MARLIGELAPEDPVWIRHGAHFEVTARDLVSEFRRWHPKAYAMCQGGADRQGRYRRSTFGSSPPSVGLIVGGPGIRDIEEFRVLFGSLREAARRMALDIVYGYINVGELFWKQDTDWFKLGLRRRRVSGPPAPFGNAVIVADRLVPTAFPYQILSKAHVERLGGRRPGARSLGDDRWELHVGEPEQWLADGRIGSVEDRRSELQRRGLELLAPVLATDREVGDIRRARLVNEPHMPSYLG